MLATADLIILDVRPEVTSDLSEGVLEFIIGMTIFEDQVTGVNLGAVQRFVR